MKTTLFAAVLCGVICVPWATSASGEPADPRLPVALTASEKAWLLGEMRENLVAILGMTSALSDDDAVKVHRIAAGLGMGPWKSNPTRPPTLIAKFQPAWMTLAAQVHKDFDAIAAGTEAGQTTQQTLGGISKLMQSCTACHATYRIVEVP